jgi:hypothetical protein
MVFTKGAMMALITTDSVGAQLAKLGQELDKLVEALGEQEIVAIKARSLAQRSEARAYLGAEGPVEERKREAFLYAEDVLQEADIAEAVVRHLKAQIKATEARIDIGRTLGATVRAELATLGSVPS